MSPRTIEETPATVEVSRRDITSVLVVPGNITAQPEVTASVPVDGRLDHKVQAGERVEAGQRVGTVGGSAVHAGASGVLSAWLVESGEDVLGDVPLATIRYDGLATQVSIPATLAYRLYSTPTTGAVSIEGGPAGISCTVLPLAGPDAEVSDDGTGPQFACLLPAGTRAMPGLPAKVGLDTATVEDALALPVEAVLGSAQSGSVTRVVGETRSVVTVGLGISDGAMVEIVDGLELGDVVEGIAPGLAAGTS